MVQGEITCECGRNNTGEMGRRLCKRSKKQKYNLKEQQFDKSKSVLHACEEGHKSDWTRASILRFEPNATYSRYKWLRCYVLAILLVTPVWRFLLFGSLWLGKNSNAIELRSFVLLTLWWFCVFDFTSTNLVCWLFYILLFLFLLNLIYILLSGILTCRLIFNFLYLSSLMKNFLVFACLEFLFLDEMHVFCSSSPNYVEVRVLKLYCFEHFCDNGKLLVHAGDITQIQHMLVKSLI